MPNLQISAADTLFFRDGRPFTMGEDTYAQSIFPPPPSVVYGALRTAYISSKIATGKLNDLITETEKLRIHNLFLQTSDDKIYAPMPADLWVQKGQDKATLLTLETKPAASSLPETLTKALRYDKKEKPDEKPRLLTVAELEKYLRKESTAFESVALDHFIETETKIGIRRNNGIRTSEEGMLYRLGMVRPAKWENEETISLRVEYSGLDEFPTDTWLQIGGEKKATRLTGAAERTEIECPTLDEPQFKIYLAIPALFKNGWYPEALFAKHGLTLIAAAIGKPLHLGGFDMAARNGRGAPKPMLKAVPAGSVYYVQATDEAAANQAVQAIHGQTISEFDMSQQGFGAAFIGKI